MTGCRQVVEVAIIGLLPGSRLAFTNVSAAINPLGLSVDGTDVITTYREGVQYLRDSLSHPKCSQPAGRKISVRPSDRANFICLPRTISPICVMGIPAICLGMRRFGRAVNSNSYSSPPCKIRSISPSRGRIISPVVSVCVRARLPVVPNGPGSGSWALAPGDSCAAGAKARVLVECRTARLKEPALSVAEGCPDTKRRS